MTRFPQFPQLCLGTLVFASLLLGFAGTHGLAAPQKVDVNTATEAELAKVPGISAELAKVIVQYREQEGPIESWDELVPLMQEAELKKRMKYLTIDGGEDDQD